MWSFAPRHRPPATRVCHARSVTHGFRSYRRSAAAIAADPELAALYALRKSAAEASVITRKNVAEANAAAAAAAAAAGDQPLIRRLNTTSAFPPPIEDGPFSLDADRGWKMWTPAEITQLQRLCDFEAGTHPSCPSTRWRPH